MKPLIDTPAEVANAGAADLEPVVVGCWGADPVDAVAIGKVNSSAAARSFHSGRGAADRGHAIAQPSVDVAGAQDGSVAASFDAVTGAPQLIVRSGRRRDVGATFGELRLRVPTHGLAAHSESTS